MIFISQYLFNKIFSKPIGIVLILFWSKEIGEGHFKVLVERWEYKKVCSHNLYEHTFYRLNHQVPQKYDKDDS